MNRKSSILETRKKQFMRRPVQLSFKKHFSIDIVPDSEKISIIIRDLKHQNSNGKGNDREIVHTDEILRVLERASTNTAFANDLLYYHSEALNAYHLSQLEKAAILSGDIKWIKKKAGKLNTSQSEWFDRRLAAEIW